MIYITQSSGSKNSFKPIYESYEDESYEDDFKQTDKSNEDDFEQIDELCEVDKELNSPSDKSPNASCKNSELDYRKITYEESQAESIIDIETTRQNEIIESKEPESRTRSMDSYEKQPRQSRYSINKLDIDSSAFREKNYLNNAHWSMSIERYLEQLNSRWWKPKLTLEDKQPEKTQAEYEKELSLIRDHNIYPNIESILKHDDKIKESKIMTILDRALFDKNLQVLFKGLYQLYKEILYQKINLTADKNILNENINTFAIKAHEFMHNNIYILNDKNLIKCYETIKIRMHTILLKKISVKSICQFNEIIEKISTNKNIESSTLNRKKINSSLSNYNQPYYIPSKKYKSTNFKYIILHVLFQIITNDINSNKNTQMHTLYMSIDRTIQTNQCITDEFRLAQKYYKYINDPTKEMLLEIFQHIFPNIEEYKNLSFTGLRSKFTSYLLEENKITENDISSINVNNDLLDIELRYDYLLKEQLIENDELMKIRKSYLFVQTMHVIFNAKAQYIQEILKDEKSLIYDEFKQENSQLTKIHILHTIPNNLCKFNFDQIIEHPFIYRDELLKTIDKFIKILKDTLKIVNKTKCVKLTEYYI